MPTQTWFGPPEAEVISLCIPSVACMSAGSGPCSQIQDSWGLTVLLQHELSAGVYSVLIRLQPETPFTTLKTLQYYLLRFPLCPLLLLPTCTLQSPGCCFTLSALGWGDLLNVLSLLLGGCYSLLHSRSLERREKAGAHFFLLRPLVVLFPFVLCP